MSKKEWTYEFKSEPIADTGDHDGWIEFTNGDNAFQTSDEIEEQDAIEFCRLLNLMPGLWSQETDDLRFKLSQTKHALIKLCRAQDYKDMFGREKFQKEFDEAKQNAEEVLCMLVPVRFLVCKWKDTGEIGCMETRWTNEELEFKWEVISEHPNKDEALKEVERLKTELKNER